MFVTISLTIFVLESLMPPVINIPGIKPGFANIVTLFLLVNTNKRSAFTVLIVRIILASIFAGQIMSLFYSLSGGILSLLAMSIVLYITKKKTVWFASVVGAIFHNNRTDFSCSCSFRLMDGYLLFTCTFNFRLYNRSDNRLNY